MLVEVRFGGTVKIDHRDGRDYYYGQEGYQAVMVVPYDMPIVGYGKQCC